MNDIEKASVARLVERLESLVKRSNGTFNPPAWMLDKNRYGKGSLSPEEMQEWSECVCGAMRANVALRYLIECAERWGKVEDKHIFKSGIYNFVINQEMLECALKVHVEKTLLEESEDKYISVYQFYSRNEAEKESKGYCWFSDFFDDMFIEIIRKLKDSRSANDDNPVIH